MTDSDELYSLLQHWITYRHKIFVMKVPQQSVLFFEGKSSCGLSYKMITIIIMMIVSDATIWSVTYDHNWWHYLRLELARIINYDHNSSFIVLATAITIVNYDRKTFIVQATVDHMLVDKTVVESWSNFWLCRMCSIKSSWVHFSIEVHWRNSLILIFFWSAFLARGSQ